MCVLLLFVSRSSLYFNIHLDLCTGVLSYMIEISHYSALIYINLKMGCFFWNYWKEICIITVVISDPLIRPLLLKWNTGLIRGVISIKGGYLVISYFTSASKILPNKRGDFFVLYFKKWLYNLIILIFTCRYKLPWVHMIVEDFHTEI